MFRVLQYHHDEYITLMLSSYHTFSLFSTGLASSVSATYLSIGIHGKLQCIDSEVFVFY